MFMFVCVFQSYIPPSGKIGPVGHGGGGLAQRDGLHTCSISLLSRGTPGCRQLHCGLLLSLCVLFMERVMLLL